MTQWYKISSEYITREEVGDKVASVISLIYIENSSGPSTEPCGTPDVTGI